MDVIAAPVPNQISEPTTFMTTNPSTSTNTFSTLPGFSSMAARNEYYRSTSTESNGSVNLPMFMPSSESTSPRVPSDYPHATSGIPSYRGSAGFVSDHERARASFEAEQERARARSMQTVRANEEKNRVRTLFDSETLPNREDALFRFYNIKPPQESEPNYESIKRAIRTGEEHLLPTIGNNKSLQQRVKRMKENTWLGENLLSSPTPTHASSVDSTCDEEALENLKESMDAMRLEATQRAKAQDSMWAINNAHLKSFSYLRNGTVNDSKALVIEILLQFRRGEGYKIQTSACCVPTSHRHPEDENELFLKRLSNQIQALTGVAPRFEKQGEDHHMVYYS
jgi:hypothetical protein